MQKKMRIRPEAGFTLLEVLLAVVILGVSLITILLQFQTGLYAGSRSREQTRAVIYAKQKLEELKVIQDLSESTEFGSFDDGYQWKTDVLLYEYEDPDNTGSYENLKHETYQLRATVTWTVGENERRVAMTTLRTVRKKEWSN